MAECTEINFKTTIITITTTKMKRILSILAALAAVTGLSVSCSDISSLEKEIDELGTRVDALENQVKKLNESILLLSKLEKATTIQKVTPDGNGGFTIIFADGAEYHITPGAKGDTGKVPVMSIRNGEWYVDYQDGKGPQSLGVKATGENGKTPEFRVYKGVWQMRYVEDGPEAEYRNVKDAEGNDVPATTEGSGAGSFSGAEISEDGTMFIVTVPTENGERQISLPIVPDFLVRIEENASLTKDESDGCYIIEAGRIASFDVTIKGAAGIKLDSPASLVAELDDKDDDDATTYRLDLYAAASTKAVVASTATDVTITITSANYGHAMARISAKVAGGPVEYHPTAIITAGEATTSSLTFNVSLKQADSYKYIIRGKDEEAPAEADFESLTATSENTLTIPGLTELTSYVLYVLPFKDGNAGEMASAEATTETNATGLYRDYLLGKEVNVAGRTYTKAIYGEARYIDSDFEFAADFKYKDNPTKIYFISSDAKVTYSTTDGLKDLILIGNDTDKKSSLILNRFVALNQGTATDTPAGEFVCFNLDITHTSAITQAYMMTTNRDGIFDYIALEKCKVTVKDKSFVYSGNVARTFGELYMKDCDYYLVDCTTDRNLVSTSSSAYTENFGKLNLTNNIFCNPSDKFQLFRVFLSADAATRLESIVFSNNTMINLIPATGGKGARYFISGTIGSVEFNHNLLYVSDSSAHGFQMLNTTDGTAIANITGTVSENARYTAADVNVQAFTGGINKMAGITAPQEIIKLDADPFEGGTFNLTDGIFIPAEAYKSYGAQR